MRALEYFLDDAIAAGVDAIQIRERDLEGRVLAPLTARVATRARATATRVLVNDRADVALAAGAHGVHLRGDSMPVAAARSCDRSWTVGRSVHDPREVGPAASADYLLFGSVFPSASKAHGPAAGLDALRALLDVARPQPVLAIGGMDPARAAACFAAGAAGVAGIGVFLPVGRSPEALGVAAAVAALRAAAQTPAFRAC